MRLASKSDGDRIITRGNFTGGLNTSTVPEMIADNQLAECINMDFNRSTGALETCSGTVTIFKAPAWMSITDLFYDKINNIFLIVDSANNVYSSHLVDMSGDKGMDRVHVGVLSGNRKPMAAMWENGLLLASGGKLQYWNGSSLDTIETGWNDECNLYTWNKVSESELDSEVTVHDEWKFNTVYDRNDVVTVEGVLYRCDTPHTSISKAPDVCNGVFIKSGRVWIWHDYTLVCSGVGDERYWSDVTDDDSSSKYINIGYKEGEKDNSFIIGVCALSSDTVILKGDGKIYRLVGDYPNWTLKEIARDIYALNDRCYCGVQDGVFVLGRNNLFFLQTTQNYGDVTPTNLAVNITSLFNDLSLEDTRVRFIPSLNQIWITSRGSDVIVFDITFKAFIQRRFNSRVMDFVTNYHDAILLARSNKVTRLMAGVYSDEKYSDDETPIDWKFTVKTETSFYEYLAKRLRISYVPLSQNFGDAKAVMRGESIRVPIPERQHTDRNIYSTVDYIGDDNNPIYPARTQFNTSRFINRNRTFDMKLYGIDAPCMINRIDTDLFEV